MAHRQCLSATVTGLLLALSATLSAQEPNLNPGLWETDTSVTFKSEQFSLPVQTDQRKECLTREKIARGLALLDDAEECDFTHKDLRADGMDYRMTCTDPSMGTAELEGSFEFNGDSASGQMSGVLLSPMGKMDMSSEVSARRVGDC